jgi:hypothetical protein
VVGQHLKVRSWGTPVEQKKTIAVDLDDTLNNFTDILQRTDFPYDQSYGVSEADFVRYRQAIKNNVLIYENKLHINNYSSCRYKIYEQCHKLAEAKAEGVKFMDWLKATGWRVVLCTYRDLSRASDYTLAWIRDNHIPYDYLFTVKNKPQFCNLWGISILIDDSNYNILCGQQLGIQVYYPLMAKHENIQTTTARGFSTFDEVKTWITK